MTNDEDGRTQAEDAEGNKDESNQEEEGGEGDKEEGIHEVEGSEKDDEESNNEEEGADGENGALEDGSAEEEVGAEEEGVDSEEHSRENRNLGKGVVQEAGGVRQFVALGEDIVPDQSPVYKVYLESGGIINVSQEEMSGNNHYLLLSVMRYTN